MFLFKTVCAQKRDTAVYFIKNPGTVVQSADSADYFLLILPPDTSVDKTLFVVKEYYKQGKIRMVGSSKSKTALKFQGPQVYFFQNGRRSLIVNYEDGERVGDELAYYPNGKLYNIKTHMQDKKVKFNECRDSAGKVLTENGNGIWREFKDDFRSIKGEGPVHNGVEDGLWHGTLTDSIDVESLFKNGQLITTTKTDKHHSIGGGNQVSTEYFVNVEKAPEFPGGIEKLYKFLARNIQYPIAARLNNTQGKVMISLTVEKDGSLTDIKVVKGIGDGCDEEAVRVVKLSPRWSPAAQNFQPVRVQFSFPVTFSLDSQ